MDFLVSFIIITILILLNGMFVAAEFAIIGVRPTRIKQLAHEGNRVARQVHNVLEDPAKVDRYIASAQLGITLASLGLGMYGEPAIAHLLEPFLHDWFGLEGDIVHTISFLIALTIITYFHVVVGEMVPKSLSLQHAERTVFILSSPMLLMQFVFNHFITVLNKIGVLVLKLLRIPPPSSGSRLITPGELELIISESVVGGLIEADEQELIASIFDFGELTVAQIMIPRLKIEAFPVTISEAEFLDKIVTSPHTRFPIYEGTQDKIVGIVHLKDVVEQQLTKKPFDIGAMLHDIPFVPEIASAEYLLSILKQRRIHMAVVIDEYGGTAGLVTLEDLIEEIVGEVRDEFDVDEEERITVVKKGHLRVQGTVRLDELREYVDLGNEGFENIDTVGGLMISRLSLPTSVGDKLTIKDVMLQIEEVDGLAIEWVAVHYPVKPESTETTSSH